MKIEKYARIIIVGCGNIGSRLLQSCAKMNVGVPVHIQVVEPDVSARQQAERRFLEVAPGAIHLLQIHPTHEQLTGDCDLAVIATDARNRFDALRKLTLQRDVRNLLLEKVLFTREDDYGSAAELLALREIPTWVNCSRSVWPGYKHLKQKISDERVLEISVDGTDWGLACNGIHFLALTEYLTGHEITKVEWDHDVIPQVRDAKRPSFKEVIGRLKAFTANGAVVKLNSHTTPEKNLSITIRTVGRTYIVNETAGEIVMFDGSSSTRRAFGTLRASELENVFGEILVGGTCDLPTFDQSSSLHLLFIRALNQVFGDGVAVQGECPIT